MIIGIGLELWLVHDTSNKLSLIFNELGLAVPLEIRYLLKKPFVFCIVPGKGVFLKIFLTPPSAIF